MNKFKLFSIAFLATISIGFAQDINQAKTAIDAEQYEKAKSILKSILQSNPTDGRANFLLGNVYLVQTVTDSAKIAFKRGLTGKDGEDLNYIGLGQIDLNNGNSVAADSNFALALKNVRRRDIEELIYIGKAYTFSSIPNYSKAIEFLNKAKAIKSDDSQIFLALGDAYYGDKNQNEAYAAYRNAFQIDSSLLRAKMQLGVLLKGAKSYDEAIKSFNEVIAINPNYGPVYRELAETYYKWGRNKRSKEEEYMKTAIGHYEKYLSLTDRSLNSRMRHADFLVLVKDYKELEKEANAMAAMDKVNPRIFRYLGYSALENNNIDLAIKSLNNYIANPNNTIIAQDYLYLAKAKFKKGLSIEGTSIDSTLFKSGVSDIKKAIEIEPLIIEDLNELGKSLFSDKFYKEASVVFEFATTYPESPNYLEDNIYYGLSIYYGSGKREEGQPLDVAGLQKADLAFERVFTASPTYLDALLYRARTNSLMANDPMTIKYYEEFIAKTTEKGAEELANPVVLKKVIEAYNTSAAAYANTDKPKAIEYFNKTLALDPTNNYATKSLELLKK
ncbi:tetratricopeptide repeat protein [Flavobacterium cellulosilyticum]|uniref:Tetratricopeptide repeat protein n=1 Tax=Flavobacterium cellulosilyticum TaxID=2541731 RepID=A0A4R5CL87_9FLAO|nr:tetratricopeptide repeat protein [Flavobacterium cellulosilyticum]TDD99153.1 tetratricopeptide repeat protein [Flavobacterium cellulosilyticum]